MQETQSSAVRKASKRLLKSSESAERSPVDAAVNRYTMLVPKDKTHSGIGVNVDMNAVSERQ
jgi:hypothetical protein